MRGGGGAGTGATSSSTTSALQATTGASSQRNSVGHLPTAKASSGTQQHTHVGQLNERPFQRHLAMNLENDMYYTVDFSENSQHSPLIQWDLTSAQTAKAAMLNRASSGQRKGDGGVGGVDAVTAGVTAVGSCRKNLVNALVKTKKNNGSSFGMNSNNWLVKFTKRSY